MPWREMSPLIVIDRFGQFVEASADEIVFGGVPTGDVETFQRAEEEIVAALA